MSKAVRTEQGRVPEPRAGRVRLQGRASGWRALRAPAASMPRPQLGCRGAAEGVLRAGAARSSQAGPSTIVPGPRGRARPCARPRGWQMRSTAGCQRQVRLTQVGWAGGGKGAGLWGGGTQWPPGPVRQQKKGGRKCGEDWRGNPSRPEQQTKAPGLASSRPDRALGRPCPAHVPPGLAALPSPSLLCG